MLLLDDGSVFSTGYAFSGIGHGEHTVCDTPRRIQAVTGLRIASIAAGHGHYLMATEDGAVFSGGHGVAGCLGHGNFESLMTPAIITLLGDERVVQVAAGNNHSLVLTRAGTVYSFGETSFGMLGHGREDGDRHPSPRRIAGLHNIQQVAAGFSHNLATSGTTVFGGAGQFIGSLSVRTSVRS